MVKDIERINIQHKIRVGILNLFQFSRSTAPAVEPLSEYKQQNQTYKCLIVSSVAGATELATI